jgi:hypothetical protein
MIGTLTLSQEDAAARRYAVAPLDAGPAPSQPMRAGRRRGLSAAGVMRARKFGSRTPRLALMCLPAPAGADEIADKLIAGPLANAGIWQVGSLVGQRRYAGLMLTGRVVSLPEKGEPAG